jgi:NTE family protein
VVDAMVLRSLRLYGSGHWLRLCIVSLAATLTALPARAADAIAAPTANTVPIISAAPITAPVTNAAPTSSAAHGRPRIGLVLSGGGARGAAHIGVLRVLEELHVPVDIIVGTSMGAIVGASYASGNTLDEMESALPRLTTRRLFTDDPARDEMSMRAKHEDLVPFIGPQFGLGADGLRLPRGAVSGVALEAELRSLVRLKGERDFNTLPIPFRAIATDITTGQMTVFNHGDLAKAIRASMAVPGLVAPLDLDGKLYVDGGLTRNLPVDVARAMGADVIIAVNLGTPLLRREQLGSVIGISAQMLAILTEQNVQRSIRELQPDDILIAPELGDFSAADFDNMPSIVPIGVEATRKMADRLSRYALTPEAYAQWRAGQGPALVRNPERGIDVVRIEGTQAVNPEVLLADMNTHAGAVFDQATLDADLRRLYGHGDFAHVGYRIEDIDGQRVLTVVVTEKPWGPGYARFGLGLKSDLRGDSTFDLYGRYRRTWMNDLGGELRVDLRLGAEARAAAEFYQPLDVDQRFFVVPRVEGARRMLALYEDGHEIARFDEVTRSLGFDVGANLGRRAELRSGLVRGTRRFSLDIGPAELESADTRIALGAWRTQLRIDTLDSVVFPREGVGALFETYVSRDRLGGQADYGRWLVDLSTAFSSGAHTLQFGFKAGGRLGDQPIPVYDQFPLGGPLALSGYRPDQFRGERMQFGRVLYQGRIFDTPLLRGAFAGLSLETGRVRDTTFGTDDQRHWSIAPFIAVDSPLGPLSFGLGFAPGGNRAAYLFLGQF